MDWAQDMTERWVRIMSAAGDGSTPLDEAVRQLSEINGASRNEASGKKRGLGRLNRNDATPEVGQPVPTA